MLSLDPPMQISDRSANDNSLSRNLYTLYPSIWFEAVFPVLITILVKYPTTIDPSSLIGRQVSNNCAGWMQYQFWILWLPIHIRSSIIISVSSVYLQSMTMWIWGETGYTGMNCSEYHSELSDILSTELHYWLGMNISLSLYKEGIGTQMIYVAVHITSFSTETISLDSRYQKITWHLFVLS